MRYIERQGARIGFDVVGEGPAVVLGHSLLCDGRMWDGVLPELARSHRVVNVDLRGHRASRAPGPFTLEDLAEDFRAILDCEGIDRAAFVGLSMGGMTAMRFALAKPGRVAALVLLDTSADPEPMSQRIKYRAMAEIVRTVGHKDALYAIVGNILFGETTRREQPSLVRRELDRIVEKDPAELYRAVRAVIERGSIAKEIAAIRCPTLVLVGDEDGATPRFRAESITQAIHGARFAAIPRAGHLSALEAPAEVTREIGAFLSSVPW